MTTYVRTTSAIAAALILAACTANTAAVKPNAGAPETVAQNPYCLNQTGSRIAASSADCAFGRSYSSDDMNRTGATTTGDALRLLDPSIRVHQ